MARARRPCWLCKKRPWTMRVLDYTYGNRAYNSVHLCEPCWVLTEGVRDAA